MSVIANVDFETNNLNVFTGGTSDADGDMTIQAAAALCGTNYGLQVVIDDTNAAYGSVGNLNSTTGKVRARFYIDPNSPTFDTGEDVKVAAFRNTSAAFLAFVSLLKTGSNWYIAAGAYNDASSFTAATSIAITDAPHCVEFYLQRATNATSNDGRFDVWVDGTGQQSVTNIDNYDRFNVMGYVRLGAISFSGTPLGTIYLDQLVVNDDGSQIGGIWVQKFTGGLTPSGVLTGDYQPSSGSTEMTLTGGVSPSGTISKSLARKLIGAITPRGPVAYAMNIAKTLTGASTPTGTLARVLNIVRSFAGEVTMAGAAVKGLARKLTGEVTSSGTLARVLNIVRSFAGEVTSAGAYVGNKVSAGITYMTFVGAVAMAGVQTRVLNLARTLAGAITPTGTAIKSLGRKLTGAVTMGGVLSNIKAKVATFTGAVTMGGTFARVLNLSRVFSGAVTMTGILVRRLALSRIFTGAVGLAGTLAQSLVGLFTGVVALTLEARNRALTLLGRDNKLTLDPRTNALHVEDR